jgi:hypothetical protein
MVNPSALPNAAAAVVDSRGAMTQVLRDFLLSLANQATSTALQAELTALAERVTVLEDDAGGFTITGEQSVQVMGSPDSGIVQLLLRGDEANPDPGSSYGRNADGAFGYFPTTDSAVPYFIAAADTFTVAINKQALFVMPIDSEGTLVVDGYLIGVD